MSRILVAGGAGFVGSHLCAFLLGRGDEVVAVDNLITGRVENLEEFVDDPRFEFVKADVIEEVPVGGPFDSVLNLASPASPKDYFAEPIATLEVGSRGTKNLLDVARAQNARFLMASTSEVYGDPLVHPQTEDYRGNVNPTGVRSVYDEAKRYAEAITASYAREFGVEVRIARIFNTYGPRMRPEDGRVVSTFLTQAARGEPLTVYGDGSQTRSFCYVDDLVAGLVGLLDSDAEGPVNLGNPGEFTIAELAKIVDEMFGPVEIRHEPLPEDDPMQRKPDISRAQKLFGWVPKVELRQGLPPTYDAIRDEVL
ncbi:MAG: NAD-dependent epimerase/dehydratase family protein [Acidimicrobiia bacterium]|nr:NAD-dependent epimerase/dehydratase family protein [Acidimicrobiia bacterium]